jgi:integrase/recombinase XerC
MNALIEKYLHYLKVEKNASPHTILSYRTDLLQFNGYLKSNTADHLPTCEPDAGHITRADIRMWLGELASAGMNRSTIARKVASVRSFFKFAYRRGFIDTNPAQLLIIPKKGKRLPQTIDEESLNEMLDSLEQNTPAELQDRAVLELFYGTGIRLTELIQLNTGDVDIARKQFKVKGKGNKERIVPVGDQALDALKAHLSTRSGLLTEKSGSGDHQALFLTPGGRRAYPQAFRKMVKRHISHFTESEKKSPHTLRHSYATHMMNRGADIRVIKELLGHSSLAATQVYTHTGIGRLKQIYDMAHPRGQIEEKQSQKQR